MDFVHSPIRSILLYSSSDLHLLPGLRRQDAGVRVVVEVCTYECMYVCMYVRIYKYVRYVCSTQPAPCTIYLVVLPFLEGFFLGSRKWQRQHTACKRITRACCPE